jgi:hypothetical protein
MPLPIDPLPGAAHALTRAGAALLLCALAACSTPLPPAPMPEPAPPPSPVVQPEPPPPAPAAAPAPDPAALADAAARRLLSFHDRLREGGAVEWAREQARLGEAPEQPAKALELALLLAQRQQPGDLARAVALLEPYTRATAPAAWQPLARLLHARLAEQRRQEEQLERQGAQLREQQRRLEQLGAQLEALKAIERSLNNPRPAPANGPGPRP